MKAWKLLVIVLIFLNIEGTHCGKCGSDKLNIKPKQLDLKPEDKKNLASSTSYTPIKIGFDFTPFIKPSSMSSSTFSQIKTILKETRKEFSKILQVQHSNYYLTYYRNTIMTNCGLDTIGKDFANFLVTNDVIIFPMFSSLEQGVTASASHCLTRGSSQPIAGVLYINSNFNSERTNMNLYLKNILFHEIIHILGFNPDTLRAKSMMQTINSVTYVNSPNVLSKAKSYFGYSEINGVPLEDQDEKIGYHWESRYMLGDCMISPDFPEVSISDMTLALLEDTGFYKVNYYSGGIFKFGKNKGRDFFVNDCINDNYKATFEEFCDTKDEAKCSSSRSLKSSCYIYEYSSALPQNYQYFSNPKEGGYKNADYCPVPYEQYSSKDYYPNHCQYGTSDLPYYGEKIGADSLCFMSSLIPASSGQEETNQIPICYQAQCSSNSLIIKIGSLSFTCPTNGGSFTPPGYIGSITCPKYSDICSSNIICNEMFSCFTQLANKNSYNYDVSYYDYEGMPYEEDTVKPTQPPTQRPTQQPIPDDDDDDPEPPRPFPPPPPPKPSGLVGWKIALIIASLVLVKVKNNYAN